MNYTENPFKDNVTIEQIQQQYEAVVATENEQLINSASNVLYDYAAFLKYSVINRNTGLVKSSATVEQIDEVINALTSLNDVVTNHSFEYDITTVKEAKTGLAFNVLFVADEEGVFKEDVTTTQIEEIYTTAITDLTDYNELYNIKSMYADYMQLFYQQKAFALAGTEDIQYNYVALPESVTIEQIEALFEGFDFDTSELHTSWNIKRLYKNLLVSYYAIDLTTVLQSSSPQITNTKLLEQIEAAYETATTNEQPLVQQEVANLMTSYVQRALSSIGHIHYDDALKKYVFASYSDSTRVEEGVVYFKAVGEFFEHEMLTQYVTALTEYLNLAEESTEEPTADEQPLAETEQPSEAPEFKTSNVIVVDELSSYANVANFVRKDESGYTIDEAVNREHLQAFVDELTTVLTQNEHGNEAVAILL